MVTIVTYVYNKELMYIIKNDALQNVYITETFLSAVLKHFSDYYRYITQWKHKYIFSLKNVCFLESTKDFIIFDFF